MSQLFEIGFPAHPVVIEKRRRAINQCCFFAPSMVKNEIEYMHSKVEGVQNDDEEALLSDGKHSYEKIFSTGQLGLSLLKVGETENTGKQFKIIVN